MILQSYIIQYKTDFSTREDGGEIITAGIERTHAKWSTYFVTMVPDENYLDAASRLVVRDGVEIEFTFQLDQFARRDE